MVFSSHFSERVFSLLRFFRRSFSISLIFLFLLSLEIGSLEKAAAPLFSLGSKLYGQSVPANAGTLDYRERRLAGIEIQNTGRLKEKKILSFLELQKVKLLTSKILQENFKKLYETGFFQDIRFYVKLAEDDDVLFEDELPVTLVIQLEEYPVIGSLFFYGNRHVSRLTLKDELSITAGKPYTENDLATARSAVLAKYREEGFLNALVEVRLRPREGKNIIDMEFFVEEGSRIVVKEVLFDEPAMLLKPKKLRRLMETKKRSGLRTGTFSPAKFEADKQKIIYTYQNEGYLRAKIIHTDIQRTWRKPSRQFLQQLKIKLEIDPGKEFFFGSLSVRGNTIFSEKTLTKGFKRTFGEAFNKGEHDGNIAQMYELYRSRGYIFARITPVETVEDGNIVNYVFDIYEGTKAHVENIYIRGLLKTKDKVVRRELAFEEGEIFDITKLRNSIIKLQRLDFFSRVEPDFSVGSSEGLMNLTINLKEKQTGLVTGGISYSTLSGFSFQLQIKESNFLGRGQSASATLRYGLLVKEFKVSFIEPWFLGYPVSLGASFLYGKYYYDFYLNQGETVDFPGGGSGDIVNKGGDSIKYTQDSTVFSVFSGQRFLTWYRVTETISVDYTREFLQSFSIFPEQYTQKEIYDENKDKFDETPPINDTLLTYILTLAIDRDTRNSRINPSSGTLALASVSFYFGGYKLVKYRLKTELLYSPISIVIPSLRSSWSLIFAYEGEFRTQGAPLYGKFSYNERLYYRFREVDVRGWGFYNIRSFRSARFGSNSLFAEDDRPYGEASILHKFEFRIALPVELFQVVYFVDIGNLSTRKVSSALSSAAFLFDFNNFLYSTGFGFRINLSFLPIRFYWSWRFIYDREARNLALYEHNKNKVPSFVLDFEAAF